MLICHCRSVTDHQIREATNSGAKTVAQVGRICGAGTRCGGCAPAVLEIVEVERARDPYQQLPIAAE